MMTAEIPHEVLVDYQNRTVVSASNPRWRNPEHTMMDVTVAFSEIQGFEAFTEFTTYAAADTAHGVEVWTNALAGDYGDIAEYVEPPAMVPESVSARQFKLQLLASGLIDQVEAWVAAQDRGTQIAYANSGTFVRGEPMMQAGFDALGFTLEQGDAFFTAAAAL